jgi:hypothetical protein
LHNTARLNINQHLIVTGVPSYNNFDELTIGYLLRLPFTKIHAWEKVSEVRKVSASLQDKNSLAE